MELIRTRFVASKIKRPERDFHVISMEDKFLRLLNFVLNLLLFHSVVFNKFHFIHELRVLKFEVYKSQE